jgi:hypothetical protein
MSTVTNGSISYYILKAACKWICYWKDK